MAEFTKGGNRLKYDTGHLVLLMQIAIRVVIGLASGVGNLRK